MITARIAMILSIGFGSSILVGVESTPLKLIRSNSENLNETGQDYFPQRIASSMTGTQFLKAADGKISSDREQLILKEIKAGNIPLHLRQLVPVKLSKTIGGKLRHATVWVMPDYVAIGSNEDFVRVPMWPETAQSIANEMGFSLPTPRIVDAIYQQAQIKLRPAPIAPSRKMGSTAYYGNHDKKIKSQLAGLDGSQLIAGHKKDVVLTAKLKRQPNRVAIYGWHRKNGKPIQPLSLVHGKTYVDYSHGIRFISNVVHIDGESYDLQAALADPELSALFTNERQGPYNSYAQNLL